MAVTKPSTYVTGSVDGDADSDVAHLVDGRGAIQIHDSSSINATIEISLNGGTDWSQDKDETAVTDDLVYTVDAGAPCLVKLNNASGSGSYVIQSMKPY